MKKVFFPFIIAIVALITSCSDKEDAKVALEGITLSKSSVNLQKTGTETLTVSFFPENASDKELEWNTDKPEVATVAGGVITAVGTGYATITVKSKADATLFQECLVQVMSGETKTVGVAGTALTDVEGTWAMGTTVNVVGHILIPTGKSLTIEEGCQVIFAEQNDGICIVADGNLYVRGTEENRVLFSVAEPKRTINNAFAGLWGGIVVGAACKEVLVDYAIIEYTGGQITTASPLLQRYHFKIASGEAMHTLLGGNPTDGKVVVTNSVLRYANDNHFYLFGGKWIIANNVMISGGETGGDNIAPKAGCEIDICYNLIFSPNTNGFKLSSATNPPAIAQSLYRAYNNTIVNAGWRRNGDKGGGIYVEKDALASVFNNLMVNCKFLSQTPGGSSLPDLNSKIDYNFYYSSTKTSSLPRDNNMTAYASWQTPNANYIHTPTTLTYGGTEYSFVVDANAVKSASAGDKSPNFVQYDVNAVALDEIEYNNNWDFHVQSGSPVLTGALSTFTGTMTGLFVTSGLSVGGKTYTSPAPAARFGAFGTK